MNRRTVIALLGGAAGALPFVTFAALAQQPPMPVIGWLSCRTPDDLPSEFSAVHEGLRESGYAEGKNVLIEYRWARGENGRLPELAADLVRRQVDVILAADCTPTALAAKAATSTIPIVFAIGGDPVALGLVKNLGRPGGNATGATTLVAELAPKWLELMHQAVPAAKTVALLVNPTSPQLAQPVTRDLKARAAELGLNILVANASNDRELEVAFGEMIGQGAGALVIGTDAFFSSNLEKLAALSLRHRIPAIYWRPDFTSAGGFMSYGSVGTGSARQSGVYVGRILRGEEPETLPVIQVTKINLIINLKTAKALGLTIPPTLLTRADEVIE